MLHGAIGASRQLQAIADRFSGDYDVHLLDFPGHGGQTLPAAPFSISLFSAATKEYIETHQLQQPVIFGFSMGGYVALHLAKQYPQLVSRIITLGTKFHWDETVAAKETKMLDAAVIEAKVPAFARSLADMHAPNDWKTVLQRTADMLVAMGKDNPLKTDDYKTISTPTLVMLGDRDKMVTLEETVAVYRSLPDAQMAVLPGTPHPVDQVDPSLVAFFIHSFIPAVVA